MENNNYIQQLQEIIKPFDSTIDEVVKKYKEIAPSISNKSGLKIEAVCFEKDGYKIKLESKYVYKAGVPGYRGVITISHEINNKYKYFSCFNEINWKGLDGSAMYTTDNFKRKIKQRELSDKIKLEHYGTICNLIALEIQKRIG